MFVDNSKQRPAKEKNPQDPVLKMLEKNLELAERQMSGGYQEPDSLHFPRNNPDRRD